MRSRFLVSSMMFLACSASAVASEESPHDLAVRIISSGPPAYQPTNGTDEEQKRAVRFNAEPQLRQYILSDAVPEDIRVCYAMQVLVERLARGPDQLNAYKEDLKQSYDTLANYLFSHPRIRPGEPYPNSALHWPRSSRFAMLPLNPQRRASPRQPVAASRPQQMP